MKDEFECRETEITTWLYIGAINFRNDLLVDYAGRDGDGDSSSVADLCCFACFPLRDE